MDIPLGEEDDHREDELSETDSSDRNLTVLRNYANRIPITHSEEHINRFFPTGHNSEIMPNHDVPPPFSPSNNNNLFMEPNYEHPLSSAETLQTIDRTGKWPIDSEQRRHVRFQNPIPITLAEQTPNTEERRGHKKVKETQFQNTNPFRTLPNAMSSPLAQTQNPTSNISAENKYMTQDQGNSELAWDHVIPKEQQLDAAALMRQELGFKTPQNKEILMIDNHSNGEYQTRHKNIPKINRKFYAKDASL